MENEQYLYFAVSKGRLEQLTIKRELFLNPDVYIIKVKKFHSYWHDWEFEFSTEIYAESQSYVLLRTTDKWHEHDIKSLTMCHNSFCEIHYGSDSYVLTAYYTDKNLRDAFKDFEFKKIDDFEEKDTEDSPTYSVDMKNNIKFDIMADIIAEYVKNNKITKENKDMPPYKHHIINPGTLGLYFGDCCSVHSGVIQEAKHVTVKDIKFNGPATIVFYADGSKEVVKRQKNDKIDKEKAIYMAMLKHKNKKLYSIINKALSSDDPEKALAYELIKYEGGDAKLLHQLCNDAIKAEKPKKKIKKNNAKVATKKTNKKSKEDK